MEKEELREMLWWAFHQGSDNREHYDKADGKCLDHLGFLQDQVNKTVNKEFEDLCVKHSESVLRSSLPNN